MTALSPLASVLASALLATLSSDETSPPRRRRALRMRASPVVTTALRTGNYPESGNRSHPRKFLDRTGERSPPITDAG